MKCPADFELNDYAADRLPTDRRWALQQHLQACAECRLTVEDLAAADAALGLLLELPDEDDTCPDPEQLAALAEGTVSAAERSELLSHLGLCPACAREFGLLKQAVAEAQSSARVVAAAVPAVTLVPEPQAKPRRAWSWQQLGGLAAAAALLLALGTFWVMGRPGAPLTESAPTVALQKPTPPVGKAALVPPGSPVARQQSAPATRLAAAPKGAAPTSRRGVRSRITAPPHQASDGERLALLPPTPAAQSVTPTLPVGEPMMADVAVMSKSAVPNRGVTLPLAAPPPMMPAPPAPAPEVASMTLSVPSPNHRETARADSNALQRLAEANELWSADAAKPPSAALPKGSRGGPMRAFGLAPGRDRGQTLSPLGVPPLNAQKITKQGPVR